MSGKVSPVRSTSIHFPQFTVEDHGIEPTQIRCNIEGEMLISFEDGRRLRFPHLLVIDWSQYRITNVFKWSPHTQFHEKAGDYLAIIWTGRECPDIYLPWSIVEHIDAHMSIRRHATTINTPDRCHPKWGDDK